MTYFSIIGITIGLVSALVGIAALGVAIYIGVQNPLVGLLWLAVIVWWGWRIQRWFKRQRAAVRATRKRQSQVWFPVPARVTEDNRPDALASPGRDFDSRRVDRAE